MNKSYLNIARGALTLVAAAVVTACSSESVTAPVLAHRISPVSGADAQVATVGTVLSSPVSVQVLDQNGAPLAGVSVQFHVVAGGGSVSAPSALTGVDGRASVSWTMGTVAGTDSLLVNTTNGVAIYVAATAIAGDAAALNKVSGDEQIVAPGASTDPFVVKAVDQYGNAVAGVTVSWISVSGGFLSANSTVTGSDGLAQISLTTDQPATYLVTAQLQSAANVSATFTAVSQ
jgi:adhesin/invasin